VGPRGRFLYYILGSGRLLQSWSEMIGKEVPRSQDALDGDVRCCVTATGALLLFDVYPQPYDKDWGLQVAVDSEHDSYIWCW
jgi:hypothetical protein